MLKAIGVSSVDQLIEQTVPKHIRWYAGMASRGCVAVSPVSDRSYSMWSVDLDVYTFILYGRCSHAASLWRPRWLAPEASPNCWPSFRT